MKKCVYCKRDKNVKMSREHVISSAVLRSAFGKENRNVTRYNGKKFFDHEHVIKDVCSDCNSILSPYDAIGKEFIELITPHYKSSYVKFPCDLHFINWLIKTHLNQLRIIKDVENSKYYNITSEIYKRIINFEYPSKSLLKLYVSGWLGKKYYWDENSPRKTSYFSYRSVRFRNQNIIVSNFRVKFFDTFIFLPYLNNYSNFDSRVRNAIQEMKQDFNFNLQEIDLDNSKGKCIDIKEKVTHKELELIKYKLDD